MSDDVYARIDEITERANAATAGPWAKYPYMSYGAHHADIRGDVQGPTFTLVAEILDMGPRGAEGIADAEFIAHAREDVPWLVEQLREALLRMDAVSPRKSGAIARLVKHSTQLVQIERDDARATVARVRALVDAWDSDPHLDTPRSTHRTVAALRAALDGEEVPDARH